jgi:multidrug efflux system outer membrane protein
MRRAAILAWALAGCTLAPAYHRPALPTPSTWPQGPSYGAAQPAARDAADIGWREFFADPKLIAVIEQALANNRDLRIAIANIQSTRGAYQAQRALLFPEISADLSGAKSRQPAAALVAGARGHVSTTTYRADLAATAYEADLFGAERSLTKAAHERFLASAEGRRAFQISLVSEVASDYVTLAADRETIDVAQATLKTSQESYELVRRRYEGGIASMLDLQQAETLLEQARGDVARATTIAAQAKNALDLVVGAPVDEALLPTDLEGQTIPTLDVEAGLPSQVLLRRPDVLQAEHELKAANADIGAARAAFFPSILLTAAAGGLSPALSNVLNGAASTSSVSAAVSQTLFAGGRNVGNLRSASAEKRIALAQYEKTIQAAFREVADALAERGTIAERLDAQQKLTEAAAISVRLSTARYESGVDAYLTTLDSQRTLYAARRDLVGVKLARALNLITLYETLGGGLA